MAMAAINYIARGKLETTETRQLHWASEQWALTAKLQPKQCIECNSAAGAPARSRIVDLYKAEGGRGLTQRCGVRRLRSAADCKAEI